MKRTILCVDDDIITQKTVSHILSGENYRILNFSSGEDARDFLLKNNINLDAIVLDWEMPGMSGLLFLRWLKSVKEFSAIPVIMITAHDNKEKYEQSIVEGANYYFAKPLKKNKFTSLLNAAVFESMNYKMLQEKIRNGNIQPCSIGTKTFRIRTLEEAQKLSVYIANATDNPEENVIICELLNNAIEHGNLCITYDEKTLLIESNSLLDEINKRLEMPDYKNKYAEIVVEKTLTNMKVTIKDMGIGFDFTKFLTINEDRLFDNHGRGIAIANSFLNITYKGKGNTVEVLFSGENKN